MPEPLIVGEKFLIQVRKRRNKPSATFLIEIQHDHGQPTYRVLDVKYPSNPNNQRNMRRRFDNWYWYPANPPSWWDSGSWERLLVKATRDRRERQDALRATT